MGLDAQTGNQLTPLERSLGRTKSFTASDLIKKPRFGEEIIRGILLICGAVSIFTTVGIVYVLGTEASLLFNAEAWLPSKVPIQDESVAPLILPETLPASEETFALDLSELSVYQSYTSGNFISIGEEKMEIVNRDQGSVTVIRGVLGTEAVAHEREAEVLLFEDRQVRTINALSSSEEGVVTEGDDLTEHTYFDRIYLESWMLEPLSIGDRIRIGQSDEVLVITDINTEEFFLTVDRGVEDIPAVAHGDSEQISLPDAFRPVEFFSNPRWSPTLGEFGIAPLVVATLTVSIIAMLVALPLGLGSAIYLSEYARPELRSILKPVLEILAGVPTVVYGYFAIQFMTPLLQLLTPEGLVGVYNMASAGIVMGIMILPTVSSMSEDALSAVPRALREAAYGLGGTRLETTVKIVLPAALSGILAAFIVAVSRAVGETMIVAIAAGASPNLTFNPFEGAETMTGHIVRISKGDLSYNSVEYNSIYAIGATLFVITLSLNLISGWIVRRFREAY
jgi:phosphate transport system permease protein